MNGHLPRPDPARGNVISREHLRGHGRGHPVVLAAGDGGVGQESTRAPMAIAPVLGPDRVEALEIRCPCGRHSYIELEPAPEDTP